MAAGKDTKHSTILFVVNPISGDIDKKNLKSKIDDFMSDNNQPLDYYFTTGQDDRQGIRDMINAANYEKVVAVGGDGTCNLLGKILVGKNIKMGIIPRGSANGLATELDLPKELNKCLNIILQGKSKKLDVLQINNKNISLHLSDIGFNANLIDRFENGKIRGFLGYGKHFIDAVSKAKPEKFTIRIGTKSKKKKAFMIVIANATKYGTGAVVNPKGKPDDGRFEIIVFRPQKVLQLIKTVIPFFTRRIHTLKFIDVYRCKKAEIKNYSRQILQIDGEVIGKPDKIFVEIIPQPLDVIIP